MRRGQEPGKNARQGVRRSVWVPAVLVAFLLGMLASALMPRAASRVLRVVRPPTPVEPRPPYGLPEDAVGALSLVVLAGQSNMSGWGPLDDDQRTDPRVFVFSSDYRWRLAREPIHHHFGQVDTVSMNRAAGVGPGLAFALSLLERRPDSRIGLIPCAKSASSIAQWQRNMSDQSLYGSCIKRIRAATTAGELAGILFFQGEADALDPEGDPVRKPAGPGYAEPFERFVADFRRDAGNPAVPFVFAQLGTQTSPEAFIHWDVIKAQQTEASFPCSAMIVTEDLPLLDGLHFTTPSFREIGARFASAFDHLVRSEEACRVPPVVDGHRADPRPR